MLGTQMKSVGEVMAIGRTFQESLQKALRGLETGVDGLDEIVDLSVEGARRELIKELRIARPERLWNVADGFRAGLTAEELFELTAIDPWFLAQIGDLVAEENGLRAQSIEALDAGRLRQLKRKGFSDRRLARLLDCTEGKVRLHRLDLAVRPFYKRVDSCEAEFSTSTAYM